MTSWVKLLEFLAALNSVKHSASLGQRRPRIIRAVQEQRGALNCPGVVHGIMLETIESPLASTPKDEKLGTWKGWDVHRGEAIANRVEHGVEHRFSNDGVR